MLNFQKNTEELEDMLKFQKNTEELELSLKVRNDKWRIRFPNPPFDLKHV